MAARAQPVQEQTFDVVIVGGGNLRVRCRRLLPDHKVLRSRSSRTGPLFGGNASEEVRVHTIGIPGKGNELLKTIDTPHYPNGHADAKQAQQKREATMAASGVDCFAHHIAIGLEKDGDRIASVDARAVTTGVIRRFRAPVFIDATGDGWLGYWAGGRSSLRPRSAHRIRRRPGRSTATSGVHSSRTIA